MEFVADQREAGHERLFHELPRKDDGIPSTAFQKRYARHLRAIKVHTPKPVFHSYRHNATDPPRNPGRPPARRPSGPARQLRALAQPVLRAIKGYCLGGGLELALMCDRRLAAASARLGLPDAQLGFSPTGGLTWLLPRLIGTGRAMDLALDAEPIDNVIADRLVEF